MTTARTPNSKSIGEHRAAGVAKYHETKLKTEIAKHRPLFYKAWKKHHLDQYQITDINYNTGVVTGVSLHDGELKSINILDQANLHPVVGTFRLKEKWEIGTILQKRIISTPGINGSALSSVDVSEKDLQLIEENSWVLGAATLSCVTNWETESMMTRYGIPYNVPCFNSTARRDVSFITSALYSRYVRHNGVVANNLVGLIKAKRLLAESVAAGGYMEFVFLVDCPNLSHYNQDIYHVHNVQQYGMTDRYRVFATARVQDVEEIYQFWGDEMRDITMIGYGLPPYEKVTA